MNHTHPLAPSWRGAVLLFSFLSGLVLNAQQLEISSTVLVSDLPIIAIKTYFQTIPDEPKITASMGIISNNSGEKNSFQPGFDNYPIFIGIERRGESSQYFYPKKSYLIETRDSTGKNLNIPLLGLPKENDWILYGPYGDKTLLRNALVYGLAGKIMAWGPRMLFCNLIINNTYLGIYLFGENIKRDKNRVDIAKLVEKDTVGDDLTGGYILKIDKGERTIPYGWNSSYKPTPTSHQSIFFQYHYPEPDHIKPEQKRYIQHLMASFESSLYGGNFLDPVEGYQRYIDAGSFIDFFILNELSRNVDGYRLSTYLYKDKESNDGRLRMGPVWDFNLGFGNANYCNAYSVTGWAYKHNITCPNDYWSVPFWWARFMQDPAFTSKLKTRWKEVRSGALHRDSIMGMIDDFTGLLESSIERNFFVWPVFGQWIWPNYFVGYTYQDEIEYLKTWISNRLTWLDMNMPGNIITGYDPLLLANDVMVYPNPCLDHITLSGDILTSGNTLNLQLLSLSGQLVLNTSIEYLPVTIPLLDYPPGIYLVNLQNQEGISVYRSKLIRR